MLVSFQTAMPILMALLAILTTWLLVEWPLRIRVAPVFVTGRRTALLSQTGQIFQLIPVGQLHLREARRGSPAAPPDVRMGVMPVHAQQLL